MTQGQRSNNAFSRKIHFLNRLTQQYQTFKVHRLHEVEILCDYGPKVKFKCKKTGICDGVPSTAVLFCLIQFSHMISHITWLIMDMDNKTYHFVSQKLYGTTVLSKTYSK